MKWGVSIYGISMADLGKLLVRCVRLSCWLVDVAGVFDFLNPTIMI